MPDLDPACLFCKIILGNIPALLVFENGHCVAFLDINPLFPGHVLIIPKQHAVTLSDLPISDVGPLFEAAQLLAKAVESAVAAEGTFVAVNNRIGQTVPHLHVHVVPRRKGDGLKGFFWPRKGYQDEHARELVRAAIEQEAGRLLSSKPPV